ncbi:MAG: hypothetical protein WCA78_00330 [Rhizomicrobium sp.]
MIGWFDALLRGATAAPWLQFCAVMIALVSVVSAAISLHRQAQVSDFNSYLLLKDRFSEAWKNYRDAPPDGKDYECVEILNLIEVVCDLYDRRALHGASRAAMRDYIKGLLAGMFANAHVRDLYVKYRTTPDTFAHLHRFAERQHIKGVPGLSAKGG